LNIWPVATTPGSDDANSWRKETMNSEQWQQVEEIYHQAVALPPDKRSDFLELACHGDQQLRSEVDSLILSCLEAADFMEQPVADKAASLIANDYRSSIIGNSIGNYKMLALIGSGGMGEVYLAEDTKLGRQLAIKLLPSCFNADDERVRRFQQEARAASALNHPNIITILEVGEANGRQFLVSEFIDCVTLRQRMQAGDLRLIEALEIGAQVASALSAAHHANIVHRDVKPENIMIRPDGYVKVLDFGLAKLTDSRTDGSGFITVVSTDPGMIMGTARYMSPEQTRGLAVDERTDIWSLGVVLYEMIANCAPFEGETATDVIVSIIEKNPAPLSHYAPATPVEMEWIVGKALRKDKEERYQTAKDFLNDLRRFKQGLEIAHQLNSLEQVGNEQTSSAASVSKKSRTQRAATKKTSGSSRNLSSSSRRSRSAITSLAVLPLENASPDPGAEYLSDGITESIINNLSKLPKLKVMSRSRVFRYKGRQIDPQLVGEELNVRAVMTGRVLQLGGDLVITTELVDVRDGSQLWGEHFKRKLVDIFEVQEEIAKRISEKMEVRLSGAEKKRLFERHTENPEAYQTYLKGRYYWNKRTPQGFLKGIEYFERATRLDPEYSLAYSGLADCYTLLNYAGGLRPTDAMPKAQAAANLAIRIDSNLAEAQNSLAAVKFWYEWDWSAAEKGFRRAIRLDPNYAPAHHWYCWFLLAMGRFDEAIDAGKRALAVDPLALPINMAVGKAYFYARRFDESVTQSQKTLEMDPAFMPALFYLARAYYEVGNNLEAIEIAEKLVTASGGLPSLTAFFGYMCTAGQSDESRKILETLLPLTSSGEVYISPFAMALIYSGLGETEEALQWLEKAYAERSLLIVYLAVDPAFDNLRSEARFQKLLQQIGLPTV
jgi:serine/threonine protein kinase